jgi:hypothetical protein
MHIIGVDAAVAKAHGYVVRTARNGAKYAVRASDAKSVATPANEVGGNCGTSYLYYYSVGNREAYVDTGFEVTPAPAIYFSWHVAVTDNIGVGNHSWGDPLADDWNWATEWLTVHGTTGYSTADVTSGAAVLSNGDVCGSGDPWDWTDLY